MDSSLMKANREPKRFKISSREYGITASDAAQALVLAEEIKQNKELYKVASKFISEQLIAQRAAKLEAAKSVSKTKI